MCSWDAHILSEVSAVSDKVGRDCFSLQHEYNYFPQS